MTNSIDEIGDCILNLQTFFVKFVDMGVYIASKLNSRTTMNNVNNNM